MSVSIYLSSRVALDGRIDKFAVLVKDYYQLSDLGDPTVVTEVSNLSTYLPVANLYLQSGRSNSGRANRYRQRYFFSF